MRIKYPRTPHLPWSPGATNDDRVLADVSHFAGKLVVVTEKMDGENTTLYSDGMHARSIDSKDHWSRHPLKSFWAGIRNDIPEGWRICGENLYAAHSIAYNSLPAYFLGFSLWEGQRCFSWAEWADEVGHTFRAFGRRYACREYDERFGFRMELLDESDELMNRKRGDEAWVSERAIGRTYHRIYS